MFFPNYNYRYGSEEGPTNQRMQFTAMSKKYWTFRKAYKGFTCALCDAQHKSGMRYIGDSYNKICMKCAPIYMKNTIDGFKLWLERIDENIKICKTNETLWLKEAMAGALAFQSNN